VWLLQTFLQQLAAAQKMQSVQINVKKERQIRAYVNIKNPNNFYFSGFSKSKAPYIR